MSTIDMPEFNFVRLPMGGRGLELQSIPLNPQERGTVTHEVDEVVFREPEEDGIQTCTMQAAPMSESYTITLPPDDGLPGQFLTTDGDGTTTWTTETGLGDVVGPAVAVDDAIARYDGITGKLIKSSGVLISDSDAISGASGLDISGTAQIVLDTSFAASDAIKLNTSAGAIDIDATDSIAIDSSGGSISLTAPDAIKLNTTAGGVDIDATGDIAIASSAGRITLNSILIDVNDDITVFRNLANTAGGTFEMAGATSGSATIQTAAIAGTTTFQLPPDNGTGGFVLETDGSGVTTWVAGGVGSDEVQSDLALSNDGFVAVSDPANGTRNVRESLAVMTSGALSGLTGLNVSGSGQTFLASNEGTTDAIRLSATGAGSGIDVDAAGLVNIDSSNASAQALTLRASAAVGGIVLLSGDGGVDTETTGLVDIETSVNTQPAIALRATGVTASIELDAGTGGVRVIDGAVGLFIDDSGSAFSQQIAVPTFAGDIKWTLPTLQGGTDTVLTNNGSGILSWSASSAGIQAGYITGLKLSDATVSTKDISAGACRDIADTEDLVSAGVLTPDITASGVNGLDTGSENNNTWYSVWIIGGAGNTIASLLSISSTSPTLPGTYTKMRRIGWIRNDGSSDFFSYFTQSSGVDREFYWRVPETQLEVLTNGGATTWAAVDLDEFVPPTCQTVQITTNHVAGGAQGFVEFRPDGSSVGVSAWRCYAGETGSTQVTCSTSFYIECDLGQEIEYQNSSAGEETDIWVLSYIDAL